MEISEYSSDAAILSELGERLSQLRIDRNVTQAGLAREAGVSKRTLERLEAGKAVQTSTLVRVLRALDLLDELDRLVPSPLERPMELLRSKRSRRKRASTKRQAGPAGSSWQWGDES